MRPIAISCFLRPAVIAAVLFALHSAASAQTPTINTFFPIGGQIGRTVEVEIRGASLEGASSMLVHGAGLTGTVGVSAAKTDEAGKQVWQAKCSTCHELRSPANRSMNTAQWAATIDRMIKVRQAPISPVDAAKITAYILDQARNGHLTAQIKIADGCMPGVYELRVITDKGISNTGLFEVGSLPEIVAVSNSRQTAQVIKLPCVANGCLAANAERHFFRFSAKKGERLVFNLKGYRYKQETVLFFNPNLRLYNSTGKEIAENHGYYDLDPLIDWTCPSDGSYAVEVRDLLGRGNPGSVYRLTMGSVPYDTVLVPPAAQAGASVQLAIAGKNADAANAGFMLSVPARAGLQQVCSPFGSHPLFVSAFPVVSDQPKPASPVKIPATFTGRLRAPGEPAIISITGEGRSDFELFTTRIGSPAGVAVTLLAPDGRAIARMGNDERMEATLEAGKSYSLKVEETGGKGGPDFTYAIEARPAHPHLEVVARPANVCLRPGLAAAVEVVVTRRDNVTGEISIRAENLPPGVSSLPAVIPPDRNETLLILFAAQNARPVQGTIRILASGSGPLGPTSVTAVPQEIFYLQNQPIPREVAETVVAVRGESEFLATFESGDPISLHPRKITEVKIKLLRRDTFKGNITARIDSLPRGWVCYQETVGPDKKELTLLIRPNGDDTGPFLNRDPKFSPMRCVLLAGADGFSPSSFVFAYGMAVCVKSNAPDDGKTQ